jgi:UDP-GlcNAc:undecaprenyl-phosphate GlcNAc-1-phosphate transferase
MSTHWPILALIVGTGLIAILSCTLTRALFIWRQLLDRPGTESHKRQAFAVPYGGGSGILLALCLVLIVSSVLTPFTFSDAKTMWLCSGCLMMFALGQLDDLWPMRARWKFLLQTLICLTIVVGSDVRIDALQDTPLIAHALAVFWLLTVCNAFNLIDHGDGVSAGVGMISAGVLLAAAASNADLQLTYVYAALIGGLAGFLAWNAPPARLYMGDAGSLPLGFFIGAGTLMISFAPPETAAGLVDDAPRWPATLLAPLLITAIPIYDMGVVVTKRWFARKPLFRGDRNHISHRLERLGLPARSRLAVTVSLHLALAGSALLLRAAEPVQISIILGQTAAIFLAVLLLETTRDHG